MTVFILNHAEVGFGGVFSSKEKAEEARSKMSCIGSFRWVIYEAYLDEPYKLYFEK